MDNADLVEVIKKYLDSNNIDQRVFANKLNYSEAYVSRLLNNKVPVSEKLWINITHEFPDITVKKYSLPVDDFESEELNLKIKTKAELLLEALVENQRIVAQLMREILNK